MKQVIGALIIMLMTFTANAQSAFKPMISKKSYNCKQVSNANGSYNYCVPVASLSHMPSMPTVHFHHNTKHDPILVKTERMPSSVSSELKKLDSDLSTEPQVITAPAAVVPALVPASSEVLANSAAK